MPDNSNMDPIKPSTGMNSHDPDSSGGLPTECGTCFLEQNVTTNPWQCICCLCFNYFAQPDSTSPNIPPPSRKRPASPPQQSTNSDVDTDQRPPQPRGVRQLFRKPFSPNTAKKFHPADSASDLLPTNPSLPPAQPPQQQHSVGANNAVKEPPLPNSLLINRQRILGTLGRLVSLFHQGDDADTSDNDNDNDEQNFPTTLSHYYATMPASPPASPVNYRATAQTPRRPPTTPPSPPQSPHPPATAPPPPPPPQPANSSSPLSDHLVDCYRRPTTSCPSPNTLNYRRAAANFSISIKDLTEASGSGCQPPPLTPDPPSTTAGDWSTSPQPSSSSRVRSARRCIATGSHWDAGTAPADSSPSTHGGRIYGGHRTPRQERPVHQPSEARVNLSAKFESQVAADDTEDAQRSRAASWAAGGRDAQPPTPEDDRRSGCQMARQLLGDAHTRNLVLNPRAIRVQGKCLFPDDVHIEYISPEMRLLFASMADPDAGTAPAADTDDADDMIDPADSVSVTFEDDSSADVSTDSEELR